MDILAVREATKWCADYIRSGKVKELSIRYHTFSHLSLSIFVSLGSPGNGAGYLSLLWPQYE